MLLALSLAPLMPARAATDALAPLAWFVGSWQCAGRFADGRPIRSTETFTRELDGHWLRMHHADLPPNRYAADEWWGYDRAAGHFTVTVFDAMGGLRHYTSSGWQGDALTLENTATGGYVDRFVFHRQDASHYHFAYAHKDASGAWKTGDELTCTRMPPTPMPR
ncbi:hypothetical protein ASG87_12770 [Frateuria sp. Soil773]|nr:hypothetical protein ASG87_12770 [Frateuria sp. Soil773]